MDSRSVQEIFNEIATHLLKQNAKSALNDEWGTCAYRGEDNMRCAAGCIIPDNKYDFDWENHLVTEIGWFLTNFAKDQLAVIKGCQTIHDSHPVSNWDFELRVFAENHGLTFPEVSK